MNKIGALVFASFLYPSAAFANDALLGTWKLISNNYEVQADGHTAPTMGETPTGFLAFLPEGRVFVVFSASERKPAKTDQEKAVLLSTLTAYTGKYRVEGNSWTTDVDVAWVPDWVGTAQKREFKISGDQLQVVTTWRINPILADKGMTRGVLTFTRVK